VKEEIEKTENLYNLSLLIREAQKYISILKNKTDFSAEDTTAKFLAVSQILTDCWRYEIEKFPFVKDTLKRLSEDLRTIEEKIQKAQAEQYYEKILQLYQKASNEYYKVTAHENSEEIHPSKKYQNCIITLQDYLQEIASFSSKISYHPYLEEIRTRIKKIQTFIKNCQKEQYIAYQKWASSIILDALNQIISITILTDEDVIKIFYNTGLKRIDERFLSPEVNRVYAKVFQTIIGELPEKKAFYIYKSAMLSKKVTLEDF